jgi:hypothetical protein
MKVRDFPLTPAFRPVVSPREVAMNRFNGLASKPMSVERCGSHCEDAKAAETA